MAGNKRSIRLALALGTALVTVPTAVGTAAGAPALAAEPAAVSIIRAQSTQLTEIRKITRSIREAPLISSVPSGPSQVVGTNVGAGSATVTWAPPLSTGSSSVTGYVVSRDGSDTSGYGPWSTTVSATARSMRFDKLVSGTAYTLRVSAVNRHGTSVAESVVVGAATAPSAPTAVTGTVAGSSATVRWNPPADTGGSDVTGYVVSRDGSDTSGYGPWSTTVSATARSMRFDKLVSGTAYTLRVSAVNRHGTSTTTATTVLLPGAASSAVPAPAPAPAPAPSIEPPVAPAPTTANRSGLPWPSGVYVPGSSPAKYEAFAAWRGRPLDVAVDWAARSTWNDIINPSWLYDRWSGTPYTKVLGVAMVPEGDGSATIASCARGSYNDKWRAFGSNIKARGLDDQTIIRLGWEFNGNWYKWSAWNPTEWSECWRQIVSSAESTAPRLRWDWTTNRGSGQSLADPTRAYPGDAYVDIVGVDSYDGWPGAVDESTWQQHYAGSFGLKFWADFAKAHGKKLSVPEWGVYPGTAWAGHNGGDNPFYIQKMTDFFRAQGSNLAYEAYFNESASYYSGSLYGPVQAPRASAEYLNRY